MSDLSVCVFCGARNGTLPVYRHAGQETGQMLARIGARLIYGGGNMGIMGAVGEAVTQNGGTALGVIPTHLISRERSGARPNGHLVTETMHERKKVMFMNSDAVILLPGGAGSLEEVFEVLTWRQIGLHDKPVIVLNVAGFWDPLITLIDHLIATGFADSALRTNLEVCADVAAVERVLQGDG